MGTEGWGPQSMAEWVNIIEIGIPNIRILLEQVGRGPQFSLTIQLAVAVVTPAETSYPMSQV